MRVVLATPAAAGLASLVLLTEPASFAVASLALLIGFLLAGAKGAVDLIDLHKADLAADALTLAALGVALTRITTGNALLLGALLATALVAQGIPLAATMARCLHRSMSPRMPPGSG
jgi:hypothetical protein